MTIHEAAAAGFDRAGGVDAYERGRPEYPPSVVARLLALAPGGLQARIVDLGAGTGKFTKLLASAGLNVTAVEPVEGMRAKFRSLHPHIPLLEGSAEKIPLPDASADLLVAAQAFHWFGTAEALREIRRVLRPGGRLVLVWNIRDESFPWMAEITKILDEHQGTAPRYREMRWRQAFADASVADRFTPLAHEEFHHVPTGTRESVVDRAASISFISALPADERERVLERVRDVLARDPTTATAAAFPVPYRVDLFWCEAR